MRYERPAVNIWEAERRLERALERGARSLERGAEHMADALHAMAEAVSSDRTPDVRAGQDESNRTSRVDGGAP